MIHPRISAYLASTPSYAAWTELRSLIVPGTSRTLWQAWLCVDGSAPMDGSVHAYPDPFTLRRALRAATQGHVPVGLGAIREANQKAPRLGQIRNL